MSKSETILAFDTAMLGCSVSVKMPDGTYCTNTERMARGQAEHLVPMIDKTLEQTGVLYEDLTRIVVTRGPGAFTGLRIGLSTARALGLALNVPVSGLNTTDILAQQFFSKGDVAFDEDQILVVLIETKRQDFYVQLYDARQKSVSKAEALSLTAVEEKIQAYENVLLIGDAVSRFEKEVRGQYTSLDGFDLPNSEVMADMAMDLACLHEAEPLYLRGADVSEPKRQERYLADVPS